MFSFKSATAVSPNRVLNHSTSGMAHIGVLSLAAIAGSLSYHSIPAKLALGASGLDASTSAVAEPAAATPAAQKWLIRADEVHTAAGAPLRGGVISVVNGKIAAVVGAPGGDDSKSDSDDENTIEVFAVTPGMIDLGARLVTHPDAVEQSTEAAVWMRVSDSLDFFHTGWDRELRSGVTAVLASPPDNDVMGGLSCVVKTGGAPELEARLVKQDAALRGSMGTQPSMGNTPASGTPQNFYVRRPATRMGVEWIFRKSFYDAIAAQSDPERDFEGADVLQAVMRGEIPMSVQAWLTQDIRTAIFLKEEFKIPHMWVDAAAEAWKEPDLLVRSKIGVVFPPFSFNGRVGREGGFLTFGAAKEMHELGVNFAFSGHGTRDVAGRLAQQPALAMRGGLNFQAALRAATINPARMAGVDDRLGSIEVGKDADLVLWSGRPFLPTSRVVGVILNGELVLDPRKDS